LATSSNAAAAQLAAGDGLIFGPGYSKQEAPRQSVGWMMPPKA